MRKLFKRLLKIFKSDHVFLIRRKDTNTTVYMCNTSKELYSWLSSEFKEAGDYVIIDYRYKVSAETLFMWKLSFKPSTTRRDIKILLHPNIYSLLEPDTLFYL